MSDVILLKRNSTSGSVPALASLAVGELGLNTADGTLFSKIAGIIDLIRAQIIPNTLVVDFGTSGDNSITVSTTFSTAMVGDNVHCSISGDVPNSSIDELEMEPLVVSGHVPSNGTVEFIVSTANAESFAIGQRKIIFHVG